MEVTGRNRPGLAKCEYAIQLFGEIVRYLPNKKISPGSQAIANYADRVRTLPGPAPDNLLRVLQMSVIQIGSFSVDL